MVKEDICCCCEGGEKSSCMVCGRPLVYFGRTESRVCSICGKEKPADAACEAGHFVCDDCHSAGAEAAIALLLNSRERDPVRLYIECCRLCSVHMHGPEHHCIVPCVMLTAYHNCGGELELEDSLREAWRRGKKGLGRGMRLHGRLRRGGRRGDIREHPDRRDAADGGCLDAAPGDDHALPGRECRDGRAQMLQAHRTPGNRGGCRVYTGALRRRAARLAPRL